MTPITNRLFSNVLAHHGRTNRRRLIARSAALGASLAVLPSIGSAPGTRAADSTFTLAANWAASDIDPHSGYDPGSGLVLAGIYESLIRQSSGPGEQLQPWLAESWEANDDASSWTFHLRPGVTFQDGTPLTATAARDSFVRQMTLQRAPANVLGRFLNSPSQIVAVDELTLRFDLGRSQPIFAIAMAAPYGGSIMNVAAALQHEVDGDLGHAWCQMNAEGLGTGPYQLASFDIQSGAVLERFDDYWGGWDGNHFDTIVIRVVAEAETRRELIERGDVDLVENIGLDAIDELEQKPDLVVDRQSDLTVRYFAITQAEPFLQPEARQALCWAFPYEEVLQGVFLGYAEPAQGAVSVNCNGFSPSTSRFTTDLEKARALLAEAGIPEGTRIRTVSASGNALIQSIAELFQHNLSQIGIQLDIEIMDFASYIGLAYGDLPAEERPLLFPAYWTPDYDDAWSQLWPLTDCAAWSSGNTGHYCNDRVDELLQTANEAPDEEAYQAALAEVQEIVAYDDPAGIYFALPQWITVLRSDIKGFALHPVVSSRIDYYALSRTP